MIQILADRHDALERPCTPPALEARDPAKAGRARDRSAGLGAERREAHAARDRRRAACARPAGRVLEVPGITCPRRIVACELGRLGLADDDRPEVAQVLHDGRISLRAVSGAQRRPCLRREPRCVDDVLDGNRDTEQRQATRLFPRHLGLTVRGPACAIDVNFHPCADLRFRRRDSLQALVEDFDRAEIADSLHPNRLGHPAGPVMQHVRPARGIQFRLPPFGIAAYSEPLETRVREPFLPIARHNIAWPAPRALRFCAATRWWPRHRHPK